MNVDVVRSWNFFRQNLSGVRRGGAARGLLARCGWARTVGGHGPYLGLFARGGLSRAAVDSAVAEKSVLELPAARGCTYLVPADDFSLALRIGARTESSGEVAMAKKRFGFTDAELDRTCAAVLDALSRGPLDPRALKDVLPKDVIRHFGDEGKKRGLTTSLPMALGRLQSQGKIHRIALNGRLESQRYSYALWDPSPGTGSEPPPEETDAAIAERYFRWTGPAKVQSLASWSGMGVKAARAAAAAVGVVPVESGSDSLMFADDLDELRSHRVSPDPEVVLVGSLDSLTHLRWDLSPVFHPDDLRREVTEGRTTKQLGQYFDLPHHAIVDRGRVIGFWDFDVSKGEIVWTRFASSAADVKAAVETTEAFVRDELGDARSFSLDTPESRGPRLAALR